MESSNKKVGGGTNDFFVILEVRGASLITKSAKRRTAEDISIAKLNRT
jgi:hypothetical protein